jgi:hypothetical protein
MKITNLEDIQEIRLETVYGHFPVGIYSAARKDGVLMITLDIDREAANYTLDRPNIEAEQRKKSNREYLENLELRRKPIMIHGGGINDEA